jgi:hypothetical protein
VALISPRSVDLASRRCTWRAEKPIAAGTLLIFMSVKRLEPLGAEGQPGGLAVETDSMLPLPVTECKRKLALPGAVFAQE